MLKVPAHSRFKEIQAGFDIFQQKLISTQLTIKGFKVENRELPSLHTGSLEIILTVPLSILRELVILVILMNRVKVVLFL